MIRIVAGNHMEFQDYVLRNGLNLHKASWVNGPGHLAGILYKDIVVIGTWYERDDAKEIEFELERARIREHLSA